MAKSWRADFQRWMLSMGIDPTATGAGLPVADGVQPVVVVGKTDTAVFAQRRMYARTEVLIAGAGEAGGIQLRCSVPTYLHHISAERGGAAASIFFEMVNTVDAPAGVVVNPTTYLSSTDVATNPPRDTFLTWSVVPGGINLNYNIDENDPATVPNAPGRTYFPPLEPFYIDPGRTFLAQDQTLANVTVFRIIWEEQLAGPT